MLGSSPPPVDALKAEGWAHNGNGEVSEGKPQCKGGWAHFRHSQELQAQDVLRTKVVKGGIAYVGFAAESFDVEKHVETVKSTAGVSLINGSTIILSAISQDGQQHIHSHHIKDYIPKTLPYDVALRIMHKGRQRSSDSVQRRRCVARLCTGQDRIV